MDDLTPKFNIISARDKIIPDDTPFGQSFGGLKANATSIQQGFGDDTFKVSSLGIHLGNAVFADASFSVNMQGNLKATSATISGNITATTGAIGGFDIGSDYIRDVANSFGLASTVSGGDDVRFWAGDTFANRATADFRVTESGALVATSATITGAITIQSGSGIANLSDAGALATEDIVTPSLANIALRGWTQTCVFSVTDADTVAWGVGSFISADGTTYSISGGNTGNMTVATYIYLDIAISTTAYQTTITAATAVGAGKVLIAKAQNGTGEATFQTFGGIGGQNIDAASIVANSITANELSTSITYAGSIIIDTAGLIRSGQTAYDTGTGWWIGNDGGTPKLSIGNSAGNKLIWDGSAVSITGAISGSSITGGSIDIQSGGNQYLYIDTTGYGVLALNDKVGSATQIAALATQAASAAGVLLSINKSVASASNNNIEFLVTSAGASGNNQYISYNGTSGSNATGYSLSIAHGAYTTNSAVKIAQSGSGAHFNLNSLASNPTTGLVAGDLAVVSNTLRIYNGSLWQNLDGGNAIYGDGSDGDVTISADTNLSADMYYDNLTVNLGKFIDTKGYLIFVKGTLTNNGTIKRTGNAGGNGGNGANGTDAGGGNGGTAGTAGTALSAGTLLGSIAGAAGGNGGNGGTLPDGFNDTAIGNPGAVGSNGSNVITSMGVAGQTGRTGASSGAVTGDGGSSGGNGGSGGTVTAPAIQPRNAIQAVPMMDWSGTTPTQITSSASSGGSGGSGGGPSRSFGGGGSQKNTGGGGGGGGGTGSQGGIILIVAKNIVNNGTISSAGGNGGNGGDGGNGHRASDSTNGQGAGGGAGAGGLGGQGGVVVLIYNTYSGDAAVVPGGSGGTAGAIGTGEGGGTNGAEATIGLTGNTGTVITITN